MFATTVQARTLLKLAFEAAGSNKPEHTYTEKTSEFDKDRRSVVFPVHPRDAFDVIDFAKSMFEEQGYNESMPRLTITTDVYGSENTYIRVIAYKD